MKRSALGDMSEVRLIPGELNEVLEGEEKSGNDERTSGAQPTVEMIDKYVYDSMEVRKVGHFRADTTDVQKTDGRITLKTEAGKVIFEDCTEDAVDDYRDYQYLGVYEALNKYSYPYNIMTISLTVWSIKSHVRSRKSMAPHTFRPT